ncbi:MAG: N-acetylneuraminate synthase family protein, partial [Gammaproteobacteria bacterium]|nr:N-acetylneuraminate synthase family protein [Gammaproteobacteria bacterium]
MQIADYKLGGESVFVIAEIGNNHNGSVKLALEMVDAAHEAGANCVKFQMRNMASVYRKKSLAKEGEDLGTEYVLDLLERFQLTQDEHKQVAEYCHHKGILYMCTP